MGVPSDARHYQALNAALVLWSNLIIRYDCWYEPTASALPPPSPRRILPPPIQFDEDADGLHVKIDATWYELFGKQYSVKVPLPLPLAAAQQNLILWLLTAVAKALPDDPHTSLTQRKSKRQLCRIIGVNHGTRNAVLKTTIAAAARWFEEHYGTIHPVNDEDGIAFVIKGDRASRSGRGNRLPACLLIVCRVSQRPACLLSPRQRLRLAELNPTAGLSRSKGVYATMAARSGYSSCRTARWSMSTN